MTFLFVFLIRITGSKFETIPMAVPVRDTAGACAKDDETVADSSLNVNGTVQETLSNQIKINIPVRVRVV